MLNISNQNFQDLILNLTLFIMGVFALAACGSPNYIILTLLTALWSIRVGRNLPIYSSIFPGSFLEKFRCRCAR